MGSVNKEALDAQPRPSARVEHPFLCCSACAAAGTTANLSVVSQKRRAMQVRRQQQAVAWYNRVSVRDVGAGEVQIPMRLGEVGGDDGDRITTVHIARQRIATQ